MAKKKPKAPPEFENLGSLITIKGKNECLGYLMDFKDKGIWDANYGKVEISPEHAKTHNECYSKAQIDGLDACKVGQCGDFYLTNDVGNDKCHVATFIGTIIAGIHSLESTSFKVKGQGIEFVRKGRTFAGRIHKENDLITIKRIA